MSLLLNQVSIQGYSSSANSYPIKKRMSLGVKMLAGGVDGQKEVV